MKIVSSSRPRPEVIVIVFDKVLEERIQGNTAAGRRLLRILERKWPIKNSSAPSWSLENNKLILSNASQVQETEVTKLVQSLYIWKAKEHINSVAGTIRVTANYPFLGSDLNVIRNFSGVKGVTYPDPRPQNANCIDIVTVSNRNVSKILAQVKQLMS